MWRVSPGRRGGVIFLLFVCVTNVTTTSEPVPQGNVCCAAMQVAAGRQQEEIQDLKHMVEKLVKSQEELQKKVGDQDIRIVSLEVSLSGTQPTPSKESECLTVSGPNPGMKCVFPFNFEGQDNHVCVPHDGKHWCGVEYEYQGKWGYCDSDTAVCPHPATSSECLTVSGPNPGMKCVFPFNYEGQDNHVCVHHDGKHWCGVEYEYQGKWGYCDSDTAVCPHPGLNNNTRSVLTQDASLTYIKTPIRHGQDLSYGSVQAACSDAGLAHVCFSDSDKSNLPGCLPTEGGGYWVEDLSMLVCGHSDVMSICAEMWGLWNGRKDGYGGGDEGLLQGSGVFGGGYTSGPGSDYRPSTKSAQYWALCADPILTQDASLIYHKTPIRHGQVLSYGTVQAACSQAGLAHVCFSDSDASNLPGCLPMAGGGYWVSDLSKLLCGHGDWTRCDKMWGLWNGRKDGYGGGDEGVLEGSGVFGGGYTSGPGNDYRPSIKSAQYWAFCADPK